MKKVIKDLIIPLLCALLILLIFRFLLLAGYVPTASMEPAIPASSYILGLRLYCELRQGDVVIFRHGNNMVVKRIAAVPGHVVEINGTATAVPDSCYYLLGDNAKRSVDSRYWKNPFIPKEDILAILIFP